MKTIPLSQGLVTVVDDEDFARFGHLRWYAGAGARYATRNKTSPERGVLYLHRLITGVSPGMDVDHTNGDTLDNRRSNLRVCSRAENMRNSRKHADSSSKFKGVSWSIARNRWQARIYKDGEHFWLGLFTSEHNAARAYNEAALKHYGEFAKLNVITDEKESPCQVA